MQNLVGASSGMASIPGRFAWPISQPAFRFAGPSRPASITRRPTTPCCTSKPQSPPSTSPDAPAADASDAASLLGTAWDPEGLFGGTTHLNFAAGQQMGNLIARREQERAARRANATPNPTTSPPATNSPSLPSGLPPSTPPVAPPTASPRLPPDHRPLRPLPSHLLPSPAAAADGLAFDQLPASLVSELDALLARDFMSVDLSWPGLRVVHLDPPVLLVEDFMEPGLCDTMIQQAESSGRMVTSCIGASNVSASYGNTSSSRRTSTSMMLTPGVAGPVMDNVVSELHSLGKRLLRSGEGPAWGPSGKLPRSSQYCYETLQVARYETGQHFLAHEDGFPPAIAAANRFQRHATLLLYLNDVPQGGATRFDHLDLAVRPRKGRALLFFPAFSDGTSDMRSLHTAEDAVDTKYVTQQWIARGLPAALSTQQQLGAAKQLGTKTPKQPPQATQRSAEEEEQLEQRVRSAKNAKTVAKGGKGFGSKPNK